MTMTEESLEEAHYYWVLSEILDMIEKHGYINVLLDIDRGMTQRGLQE